MLGNVRVVELGEHVAAPQAGAFLADFGADVVKIERPGGDPGRGLHAFQIWNRGKRCLELDLKTDAGRLQAEQLIAAADVVLEGLRPGVLSRLGLDADALLARYPQLIWCRIPAFAAGLARSDGEGYEPLIAAQTGMFGGTHMSRRHPPKQAGDDAAKGQPVFAPLPFGSAFAAVFAANAVGAALHARRQTGVGQLIEVPIQSALITVSGFIQLRIDGRSASEGGAGGTSPLHTCYRCSDGRWFFIHVATERMFRDFVRTLNLGAWVEEGLLVRAKLASSREAAQELHRRFEQLFPAKTSVEWETILSEAGISCSVARTTEEWAAHPSARAAGLSVEVAQGEEAAQGEAGQAAVPRLQPGAPARVDGRPLGVPRPPRTVQTREVGWLPRARPARNGRSRAMSDGPLTGLRVIDFTHYIAGPTCGRTLAEFGADVIKIDAPSTPYFDRFWRDVSRGKRSMVLDLKSEVGSAAVTRLVKDADVVVENFRLGVAERLGIGFDAVQQLNPRAVYASLNCYGYAGAFADRPGWEQLGQAVSGMMIHAGGNDAPPASSAFAVNDYGTGLTLAMGVLAALNEVAETGRGLRVSSALAGSAEIWQVPYLAGDFDSSLDGRGVLGYSALSRLYECADAWIYLHCPPRLRYRLEAIPVLADTLQDPRAAESDRWDSWLACTLAARIREDDGAWWLELFRQQGVPAAPVLHIDQVNGDPAMRAAGLTVEGVGPAGERIEHVGVPCHFGGTPARMTWEAPLVGADTDAVLREIGLAAAELSEPIAAKPSAE